MGNAVISLVSVSLAERERVERESSHSAKAVLSERSCRISTNWRDYLFYELQRDGREAAGQHKRGVGDLY